MDLLIGGPIVLVYLFLTYASATWAFRWTKRHRYGHLGRFVAVAGVSLVATAIPFGDHLIGYIHFKQLCEREAGAKIYQRVSDVEGLLSPTADGQMAMNLGLEFVEEGSDLTKVRRYEVRGSEIVKHENVPSVSRYALQYQSNEGIFWVSLGQYVITDLSTGQELAVFKNFAYHGGWLVRVILSGYGGTAARCPSKPFDLQEFVSAVLKPKHAKN